MEAIRHGNCDHIRVYRGSRVPITSIMICLSYIGVQWGPPVCENHQVVKAIRLSAEKAVGGVVGAVEVSGGVVLTRQEEVCSA